MRYRLRLEAPRGRIEAVVPAAIVAALALLALAAAQPVLASREHVATRGGADVFIVLDTSRSMLAARSPGAPTRFERSRAIAERLVRELPPVPIGLASLTDRILPHAFPTASRADLEATLREAIGVERPPPISHPTRGSLGRASSLAVLEDLGDAHYFAPSSRRRIAVLLTDGETRPFDHAALRDALRRGRVELLLVHVWDARERVWVGGSPARDYRPDAASGPLLRQLADEIGGRSFGESDVAGLERTIESSLGGGQTDSATVETGVRELAPIAAAAALFPLGLVVWRRNLV